jgi:tRNA(Ile)-lysidine synthase
MADKVELAFRRAALRLIPEGTPLLVAVSGGGDSVALLHLLLRFAAQRKNELTVGHLDHGLRRGARADRRFVEGLGRRLGLPCIAERHEMSELKMKRESPEEASRRVRRAFLLGAAKQVGAELIVTGHTLDDQAETILMRLVRGAGATALTGMAASGPGPFVRPLLEIEREELRGYLKRRDLAFREDPSNRDLRFDRNRVRRVALPLLAETLNPRASRHLVKAARMLREDALYLDAEALNRFEALVRPGKGGVWWFKSGELAAQPDPIAKRVVRRTLERAGVDPRRLAARHVEGVLDLARRPGTRELHLPGALARRRGERVTVRPT